MDKIDNIISKLNVNVRVIYEGREIFTKSIPLEDPRPQRQLFQDKAAAWLTGAYRLDISHHQCRIKMGNDDFMDGDFVTGTESVHVEFFELPSLELSRLSSGSSSQSMLSPASSKYDQGFLGEENRTSTPKASGDDGEFDYSKVPANFQMYCFRKTQAYDIDRVIDLFASTDIRNLIMANLPQSRILDVKKFECARRNLLRICADFLLKKDVATDPAFPTGSRLRPAKLNIAKMAFSCVVRFPLLREKNTKLGFGWEYLFCPSSTRNRIGLLAKSVSNKIANNKQEFDKIRSPSSSSSKSDSSIELSTQYENSDDECESIRVRLKTLRPDDSESKKLIMTMMGTTRKFRKEWIDTAKPHPSHILEKWPRLSDQPSLILEDAEFLWKLLDPDHCSLDLRLQFQHLVLAILNEAKARADCTGQNSPNSNGLKHLLGEFHIKSADQFLTLDQDEAITLSLMCLPYILSQKQCGSSVKCFEEVFCFKKPTQTDLKADIETITDRTQPFLLAYTARGCRADNISEIYLVVDHIPIKMVGSVDLLGALEILHALFWVFRLKYPPSGVAIYHFIDKIKCQSEIPASIAALCVTLSRAADYHNSSQQAGDEDGSLAPQQLTGNSFDSDGMLDNADSVIVNDANLNVAASGGSDVEEAENTYRSSNKANTQPNLAKRVSNVEHAHGGKKQTTCRPIISGSLDPRSTNCSGAVTVRKNFSGSIRKLPKKLSSSVFVNSKLFRNVKVSTASRKQTGNVMGKVPYGNLQGDKDGSITTDSDFSISREYGFQ